MAGEDSTLMASLYVGDLHPNVIENDLVEMFGRVGRLLSVRICRDKISLKSLCYGYVNFWFRCHASAALKCLNHTRLKGKMMRIMWCQRNPVARKSGVGNLFVKNLDPSITGARLQEIFSKYGTILSCKVAEEKGISKGFGFVQFESEDSAITALNALHDTVMEGKKLYVSKFFKMVERKKNAKCGFKNLYVKNLDEGITEDILKEKFSEHGKVWTAVIMKDDEGKSKGYGFVNFNAHEGAEKAIEALNGELLGSKNLSVAWAQRRGERTQRFGQVYGYKCADHSTHSKASNLYVKNLDPSVDDKRLEELFSRYGKVVSSRVIRDGDGVSKNFGFVRFSCPEDAKEALNELTGTDFEGRTLHVTLAYRQERQTSELLKSWKKFPPNYSSDCQPLDCRQFPCFSPPTPVIQLNRWNPTFCQTFTGPFTSCNPFQGQVYRGIINPFPLHAAALGACRRYSYSEYQIKTSSRESQNKITGDMEEYGEGHGAVRTSLGIPFPEVHKIGQPVYVCHTLGQNLQVYDYKVRLENTFHTFPQILLMSNITSLCLKAGLAASGSGLQLEMAEYDAWSILKSSKSFGNAY